MMATMTEERKREREMVTSIVRVVPIPGRGEPARTRMVYKDGKSAVVDFHDLPRGTQVRWMGMTMATRQHSTGSWFKATIVEFWCAVHSQTRQHGAQWCALAGLRHVIMGLARWGLNQRPRSVVGTWPAWAQATCSPQTRQGTISASSAVYMLAWTATSTNGFGQDLFGPVTYVC